MHGNPNSPEDIVHRVNPSVLEFHTSRTWACVIILHVFRKISLPLLMILPLPRTDFLFSAIWKMGIHPLKPKSDATLSTKLFLLLQAELVNSSVAQSSFASSVTIRTCFLFNTYYGLGTYHIVLVHISLSTLLS